MINALRMIEKRRASGRRAPMHARRLRHSSIICGLALLLGSGWAGQALAVCTIKNGKPPSSSVVTSLPATTTLKKAAIGGVMASYVVDVYTTSDFYPGWDCGRDSWGMGPYTTTLAPVDADQGIYDTGIPGVGIRIRFHSESGAWPGTSPLLPPFDLEGGAVNVVYPSRMRVEFIRTGVAVGKGDITPFDFETDFYVSTAPQTRIPISGAQLKTELDHNVYYTSCRNATADPQINMGQGVTIAQVRSGNVETRDFSLDIRCDGMNPTTKPPVKIWFEGEWQTTGSLLKFDGAGQQDVAKGAAIKLSYVQSNGSEVTRLPTTKAEAVNLTWSQSAIDSEYYRFRGRAKYAPTGAEMKEGKAAGTLSYVLDYN